MKSFINGFSVFFAVLGLVLFTTPAPLQASTGVGNGYPITFAIYPYAAPANSVYQSQCATCPQKSAFVFGNGRYSLDGGVTWVGGGSFYAMEVIWNMGASSDTTFYNMARSARSQGKRFVCSGSGGVNGSIINIDLASCVVK